jgi:hypothetical protein
MTAVMRAAARPGGGPRVLRAALVRGGKVVDERILQPGAALTVGPSEHNTFVVALPASTTLLERGAAGYELRGGPGVGGRVATSAGITEIGAATVPLGEDARGKIIVGDAVVLFHFVDPPVRPPRAHLPLAVQQGAFSGLDWKTTCIAAFSFLAHFGAVGAVYSDWADPEVDDGATVQQVIGLLKEIPHPPSVETSAPVESPDAPSTRATSAEPSKAAPSGGRPGGGQSGGGRSGGAPGRVSDARAAAIAAALQEADAAVVLAIGARGNGAVDRVLQQGDDVSLGMLNHAAASPGGVGAGNVAGLNIGPGGGVVRPGVASGGGLPGAANRGGDAQARESGTTVAVKKPVPSASFSPPETSGGVVPDAGRVVGGLRGAMRNCYRHGLEEDMNMRGSARAVLSVGPAGEVRSVQMTSSGLSSKMSGCLKGVMMGAQFGPPQGGGATVVVPMSFLPQQQ